MSVDQFAGWNPYNFATERPVRKLRQSVIAHLLKSGQDPQVIQSFTGHKRVSSVEEYQQTGLEELKAAIYKNYPLGQEKSNLSVTFAVYL